MVDLERLSALRDRAKAVMSRRRSRKTVRGSTRSVKNYVDSPGSLLRKRLKEHGVAGCAGCDKTASKMDRWGPEECESRREELAAEILPRAKEWVRKEKFRSALSSLAFGVDLLARVLNREDEALTLMCLKLIDDAVADSRKLQRKTVDVLMVSATQSNQWREEQTGFLSLLNAAGITAQVTLTREMPSVSRSIEQSGARLCFIRPMAAEPDVLSGVFHAHPGVKFVICCPSLPSHMMNFKGGVQRLSGYIALAAEVDNLWLGTPDEREPWRHFTKSVWVPNSVSTFEPGDPRPIAGPVELSLVGRRDVIKNMPNQILAAGLANRTRQMRLHLIVNGESSDLIHLAKSCGLECYSHPWKGHEEHRQRVSRLVNIGLQASFSESFNYVALEHLLLGKPVVGSPSIRFLPERFQADPNDIEAMSEVLLALSDEIDRDHHLSHEFCRAIGDQVSDQLNQAMVSIVRDMLT